LHSLLKYLFLPGFLYVIVSNLELSFIVYNKLIFSKFSFIGHFSKYVETMAWYTNSDPSSS